MCLTRGPHVSNSSCKGGGAPRHGAGEQGRAHTLAVCGRGAGQGEARKAAAAQQGKKHPRPPHPKQTLCTLPPRPNTLHPPNHPPRLPLPAPPSTPPPHLTLPTQLMLTTHPAPPPTLMSSSDTAQSRFEMYLHPRQECQRDMRSVSRESPLGSRSSLGRAGGHPGCQLGAVGGAAGRGGRRAARRQPAATPRAQSARREHHARGRGGASGEQAAAAAGCPVPTAAGMQRR